ncbi:hypothetical protein Hanom_Chr00s072906g01789571 [Helianthus anomalus]
MKNPNMINTNLFPDEMNVDFDMLGTMMLNRIIRQINSRDVTIYDSSLQQRNLQLQQEISEPCDLGNCVSDPTVFSLSTGTRNCRLTLRRPRN